MGAEIEPDLMLMAVVVMFAPLILRCFFYKVLYKGALRPACTIKLADLRIEIQNEITFKIETNGKVISEGILAQDMPGDVLYDVKEEENKITVNFHEYATLTVNHSKETDRSMYNFDWEVIEGKNCSLGDSFNLLTGHWYGAGHVFDQPWPLEKWNTKLGPFITGEPDPISSIFWDQYYGGLQERFWLCSTGMAIHVDFDVPLFVSTNWENNGQLKLVSSHSSPYQNNEKKTAFLRYTLVQTADVKQAYNSCVKKLFPTPTGIPNTRIFQYPIWSTWAQYKKDITQELVLKFADDIRNHGFKDSQLEIDDDWTPHYGDFDFEKTKFPDPKSMVDKLKTKGFRVALWMHPFISPTAKEFSIGWGKGFWVRSIFCNLPAIVSWWNGYSAEVDVTNADEVKWYEETLQFLREKYGIDTFKFDAGDAIRLSTWTKCKVPMDNPNNYSKLYAEICEKSDGDLHAQELRVCTGVQHLPMFFRLQDKDSNWGTFNGLKTVIPHVLTQGLLGYPFVLPDMIGGNAYAIFSGSAYPERELYIRWIQVNALMPAMQFSVVPWLYDNEVVTIAKKMCDLHEHFSAKIINLANEAVQTGAPICRPVWWLDPQDEVALTISSEFLLGDDVLVAPVLDSGATVRDVYLPVGTWKDEQSNVLEGGRWHKNYPAPLDSLPYFTLS